jgi:hypothetical protein
LSQNKIIILVKRKIIGRAFKQQKTELRLRKGEGFNDIFDVAEEEKREGYVGGGNVS